MIVRQVKEVFHKIKDPIQMFKPHTMRNCIP